MPINEFFQFLLYVLPGFISLEIFRAKYPAKKMTEFNKITWSIFYSIVIYLAVTSIYSTYFSINSFQTNGDEIDFRLVILLLSAGIIVGFLRILMHKIRYVLAENWERFNWILPKYITVWQSANNQAEGEEWVKVHLHDGTIYVGFIKEWSFDPDKSVQELLLGEASKVNEKLDSEYDISGQGVYLTTDSISRMEFIESD